MIHPRAVLATISCLSVLAVGGCSGDDPEPKIAPAPSTSAPSEPRASGSSRDDEARFVDTYFRTIGEATQTGDTAGFMALSSPDCANCRTLAQNIDRAFRGMSRVEGALWEVTNSERVDRRPAGSVWNVDVETARERWFDGSGRLIKVVRPSTQRFGIIVGLDGRSFQVAALRLRS